VAVLGAVILIAASCGEGRGDGVNQADRPTAREAADLYLWAVGEFDEESAGAAARADRTINAQLLTCPSVANATDADLEHRIETIIFVFRSVAQDKFEAESYVTYASRLRHIETSNEALRRIRMNVDIVASEASKLLRANIDVCRELGAWKRSGWSVEYEHRIQGEPYETIGVDRVRVRMAAKAVADTLPELQELGLSFDDALAISSSAAVFG